MSNMMQQLTIILGIVINLVTWLYITKRYLPNLMEEVVQGIGSGLSENIKEMMIDPTVKRGFGLAGKLSGESRNLKAAENNMSMAIINKTIGDYKPIIQGVLGIDVDGAIEDYGAPAVLQLIQKFMPTIQNMLGGKSNKGSGGIP